MNCALGEVSSEVIKEAEDMYFKVVFFVLSGSADYKTQLFVDCQWLYEMMSNCELKKVFSLAELCNTVSINQAHADCIKKLKPLVRRINELKETK